MKFLPISFIVLSITLSSAFACEVEKQNNAESFSEQAFMIIYQIHSSDGASNEALKEAISLLDKAVAECSDDPQFLTERANIHALIGDYERAREDLQQADRLAPLASEILLMKCLLLERTQRPKNEWLACYQRVETQYTARQKEQLDPNYIMAALMAGSADIDDIKRRWQAQKNDDESLPFDILQQPFERNTVLEQLLPTRELSGTQPLN
jgi:tetratricopeptide (TPR) repeat protein